VNHHSFRELVKETPVSTIKAIPMNPAHFKVVCFVLSMYGDYETGTRIRPSWLTVSKEAGVDRKTAMKVRDYLLKEGILIKTGVTEANISIYKFGEKTEQLSLLDDQLSNSNDQMSTIVGQNTTYYSNQNSTVNYQNKKEIEEFLEGAFS
jgi:sulfur relay (sulfurtransferase) DsrC/TusE family protein